MRRLLLRSCGSDWKQLCDRPQFTSTGQETILSINTKTFFNSSNFFSFRIFLSVVFFHSNLNSLHGSRDHPVNTIFLNLRIFLLFCPPPQFTSTGQENQTTKTVPSTCKRQNVSVSNQANNHIEKKFYIIINNER